MTVTDTGAGLTVTGAYTDNDGIDGNDDTFTNKYEPTGSFAPKLTKKLTGRDITEGEFTFSLKDEAGNAHTAIAKADGSITFSPRRFSNPGDYVYSVSEQTGTDPDIQYDTTVYRAIIRVRAQGDRLTVTVDLERNRTPYGGDMVFTNRKPMPPTGDKHLQLPLILGAGAALLLLAYALIQRKQRRSS